MSAARNQRSKTLSWPVLRKMRGAQVIPPFPEPSPALTRKEIVIGAKDLNKRFGSFQAVKDFQLEIRNGDIYGFWSQWRRQDHGN